MGFSTAEDEIGIGVMLRVWAAPGGRAQGVAMATHGAAVAMAMASQQHNEAPE